MAEYGYIRVSSADQNERRQMDAMKALGLDDKSIYLDKQSGKDFNRPAYQRMARKLKSGDVLYIQSIDRLGRNYDEIQDQWRALTKDKGADIVVIDIPLLDTRESKNLMGRFVADLVLQILSFVAQTERENIKKRQAEGIAAAKARGQQFGRPTTPPPDGFFEQAELWASRRVTATKAAQTLGMPVSTFFFKARKHNYERGKTI